MPFLAVTDAKILLAGYDFSGYANEISLSMKPALLDSTTFGTGTKKNTPGLLDISGQLKGFLDYADIDPAIVGVSLDSLTFGRIGAARAVFSASAVNNGVGDIAYGMPAVSGKITPFSGQVGALLPWEFDVQSNGIRMFRGFTMASGVITANGVSTTPALYAGGVGIRQKLYANFHVTRVSGTTPTLNVIIESAPTAAFASPTQRLAFTQYTTAIGAEHLSLAGDANNDLIQDNTDPYFRMRWWVSGTSPSYTVYGMLAVATGY